MLFAFLYLHTPLYLALAVLFYTLIWLAERLYHVFIALARLMLFAFVGFLFLQSLSVSNVIRSLVRSLRFSVDVALSALTDAFRLKGYLPPEVPAAGRRDDLWVGKADMLVVRSLLGTFVTTQS